MKQAKRNTKRPIRHLASLGLASLCCLSVADAQGQLIVFDDEWALTDRGLELNPEGAQFALNVARSFTGGQSGSFLAYSHHIGLAGEGLATAMREAGHSWRVETVTSSLKMDLPTLRTFDGVFLGGVAVDNQVLTDYVLEGGNVYLMAGTAWAPSAAHEAAYWNDFLGVFGLAYEGRYNGLGNFPIEVQSEHPVLSGVSGVYHSSGQSIIDLDPNSGAQVFFEHEGQGLLAMWGQPKPVIYCEAKLNSKGCIPRISYSGRPSLTSAESFLIQAADVVSSRNGWLVYGLTGAANLPFKGGMLCVQPPYEKVGNHNSGGSKKPRDCSGSLSVDFNEIMRTSPDLFAPGMTVYTQFHYTDKFPKDKGSKKKASSDNLGMTQGLEFYIGS